MYCVVGLPRTATTYTAHLICDAMYFNDPNIECAIEPFNPKYNTPKEIEEKFQHLNSLDPLPVIKIISSHDFKMARRIVSQKKFKTIFIKPSNLQNQVLKSLVSKATNVYFGDRTLVRKPYVNSLTFAQYEIDERVNFYKQHMSLEVLCDIVVEDRFIITHPKEFLHSLNLDCVNITYKHVYATYDDYEMLTDKQMYIDMFKHSCDRILGGVP